VQTARERTTVDVGQWLDEKLDRAATYCERNSAKIGGWVVVAIVILALTLSANDHSQPPDRPNFLASYNACLEMTKSLARYPSSFDTPFGDAADASGLFNATGIVRVNFSVKNAFGMKIAGTSRCKLTNNDLTLTGAELEDGTRMY